jgi:hypothetical protein
VVICGKAGRYRSVANGATALRRPRTSRRGVVMSLDGEEEAAAGTRREAVFVVIVMKA